MSKLLLGVALMVAGAAVVIVVQRVFLTGSTSPTDATARGTPSTATSGGKDYSKFTLPGWEDLVIGRQPPRDIEWTCARKFPADPDECRGSRPKLRVITDVDVDRRPDIGVVAVSSYGVPFPMKDSLVRRWGKPANELIGVQGSVILTWCSEDREVQVQASWSSTDRDLDVSIQTADWALMRISGFNCYKSKETGAKRLDSSAARGSDPSAPSSPAASGGDSSPDTPTANLRPTRTTASSTMPAGDGYTYDASNLVDGDLTTSWQPARNDKSPSFRVEFSKESLLSAITIANGFQAYDKHGDEFTNNSRIDTAKLQFSDGTTFTIRFDPAARGRTKFAFQPTRTTSVDVTIVSQHLGTKWKDLAVSEVEFGMTPE